MANSPGPALDEAVETANSILSGRSATPAEVLKLVETLHKARKFGLARKVLDRCYTDRAVTVDPALRLRFVSIRLTLPPGPGLTLS